MHNLIEMLQGHITWQNRNLFLKYDNKCHKFRVKSPSIIQRSVSQEKCFNKSKTHRKLNHSDSFEMSTYDIDL